MIVYINSEEDLQEAFFPDTSVKDAQVTFIVNLHFDSINFEETLVRKAFPGYEIQTALGGEIIQPNKFYFAPKKCIVTVVLSRIHILPIEDYSKVELITSLKNSDTNVDELRKKVISLDKLLAAQSIENARNKNYAIINEKLLKLNNSLKFSWKILNENNKKLSVENFHLAGSYKSERDYSKRITGILNGIPAHLALLNSEGVIVEVNDAWKKFAESNKLQDENYAIGKNYIAICEQATGEDAEFAWKIADGLRKVINGQLPQYTLEYPCHEPSQRRWFKVIVHPIKDDVPHEVVVMHLNITDRKIAELEKYEKEKKYKDLVETANNIIFSLSPDLKITFINKTVHEILGYHPEELIGRHFTHLIDESDNTIQKNNFAGLFLKQQIQNYDLPVIRKDGTGAVIRLNSKITTNDKSEIQEIVGTAIDISSKKKALESFKKSAALLKSVYNSSFQSIIILDRSMEIISFNKVAYNLMLGILGKEVKTGENILQYVALADREMFVNNCQEALSGKTVKQEFRLKIITGEMWVELVFNEVTTDEGETLGVCLITTDITKRKIDEEKINQQNQELQKTNSELDRFVYSASHDLKVPLTSIHGIINVAKIDDPKLSISYFEMIEKNIDKLMKVIKDLTNFSRNARLEVEKEPVNIQLMLEEIINSLTYFENVKRIKFETELLDKYPIYSDKLRLSILLSNLISNSVLYHNYKQDDPFVKISIYSEKNFFRIIVKDNGSGIEQKHHEKIFNMFYRVSQKSSGSGLGLYIVKGVVEKLKGEISLTSEPGKGTKIITTFPNVGYEHIEKI